MLRFHGVVLFCIRKFPEYEILGKNYCLSFIYFFLTQESQFRSQNSNSSGSVGVCNNTVDAVRSHSAVHLAPAVAL